MPLTLARLAREVGLTVHVDTGLDRPVSWVHSTELADPTPFLEGGELLLTTGIALGPYPAYARRLADAGVVGLGFGTGLSHAVVPGELVEAARSAGLAVLEVPRAVPFIAITKAVSRAVAADEYAALTRTSEAQRALTRAALTSPAAVVRRLAGLLGGAVALLDPAGEFVHVSGDVPDLAELRSEAARLGRGPAGSAWRAGERHLALQVLGRHGHLAVATAGPLDAVDRTAVNTAASLLTLALAGSDAVDVVHRELRTARFRLLLAGEPVEGVPAGPFRVFLVPRGDACWAEYRGDFVVLGDRVDGPFHASSPVDASEVARGTGRRRGRGRSGWRSSRTCPGRACWRRTPRRTPPRCWPRWTSGCGSRCGCGWPATGSGTRRRRGWACTGTPSATGCGGWRSCWGARWIRRVCGRSCGSR
nr:hypothetical protein GCM10017745_32440 [Saccharothrix mutabilis subsp. capreolus]